MNVNALVGLAEMRERHDPAAAEFLRSAAGEILRLRVRLNQVCPERDLLRAQLSRLVKERP